MIKIKMIDVILLFLMCAAAIMAEKLIPTEKIALFRNQKLETVMPDSFSNWRLEQNHAVVELPAEMKATIDKIYSETISKTYVNNKNQRVMLVIAYGKNQSDQNSVHRPEVCYPAQGFTVGNSVIETVSIADRNMSIVRLVAKYDIRNEPISYWITVGDYQVATGTKGKIAQLKYGLQGKIPDGMLFRVSTIGINEMDEYKLQNQFIKDLYLALDAQSREWLYGKFTLN
ncbi:exosortase-associated protein EpsI, B-type [Deefgea sp. CFH1-16]|uniref:exosortase-associated protein EpsI, B-type n=1 Tax=Deefgea sp. CFH1-16 TaxID=2675457 RepID=UPI0015F354F7|nr:exosortase-associated protein EpsI, B-type [Deefgea sp. CFH1-16]MBM5574872.1 EpsI family protein [Deefgea sp. CFH1-16]